VRGALLLEAIADAEKLVVSADDVQAEIAKTAGDLGLPLAQVQQQLRSPEARGAVVNRIREEKALALLTAQANFT
jgi:trigger factor